jgi:cell division protein FtsI (penicillin-binding protein 3)
MQNELMLVCSQIGVQHQAQAPEEDWVRIISAADSGTETLALQPLAVRPGRVPNVQGLTLRDALFLLENRGLRVRALGTGRVKTQSVAAGMPARRGTTVTLALAPIGQRSAGPAPVAAPAPSQLAENKLLTPVDTDLAAKTRELQAKTKARLAATGQLVPTTMVLKKPELKKAEPKVSSSKSAVPKKAAEATKPAKPAKSVKPAKPTPPRQLSQQPAAAKGKKA